MEYKPTLEDLRKIYILKPLPDAMLEELLPVVSMYSFAYDEVIFAQEEEAHQFCMLFTGKVLLQVNMDPTTEVSLGSIKPGYSFGWSSLQADSRYTTHAIAADPSQVLMIPGQRFMEKLNANHDMGYLVMQGVVAILRGRLERRTHQLMRALYKHLELETVLDVRPALTEREVIYKA